jgi:excisionase family DNA binding protein
MTDKSDSEWMNLSEAAGLLGVHPSTVPLWADKGDVPSQRTSGGHRRFRRTDLEVWNANHRRGIAPGASLVVQSALGRTRMDVSEGQLTRLDWYVKLSETARVAHRETSQRLLTLLRKYLTAEDREPLLGEARRLGADYYRLGKVSNLSLAENVRAFLYFRDHLAGSVMQMVEAAGSMQTQPLAELHSLTAHFTNEILIALIATYESGDLEFSRRPGGAPV